MGMRAARGGGGSPGSCDGPSKHRHGGTAPFVKGRRLRAPTTWPPRTHPPRVEDDGKGARSCAFTDDLELGRYPPSAETFPPFNAIYVYAGIRTRATDLGTPPPRFPSSFYGGAPAGAGDLLAGRGPLHPAIRTQQHFYAEGTTWRKYQLALYSASTPVFGKPSPLDHPARASSLGRRKPGRQA